MSNTEQQIEQEIQSKNLNAPRLTPDSIDSKVKSIIYSHPIQCVDPNTIDKNTYMSLRCLTFCTIVLENGFTVTGESACASPENFDELIGQRIAYENAREKIWELEGYLLKEQLHKQNSKVELKTGIDSLLDTRIPIINQLTDLCYAIEKCGASPELTDAVTKAGALRDPISELVKQALALGIGQGIVSVSYSDNGSHPTPDLPEFKNDDVKSFEPSCSTQACVSGSVGSNGYQLNAKRDNAFLVA
ncbi:MAG: Gp49 family protein, partial [Acinetobacter sp.]